ncbi:MAG: hypothetical protein U0797_08970 [Gemmataceae bacterium]
MPLARQAWASRLLARRIAPHKEVPADVLESACGRGRHEKEVARLERVPATARVMCPFNCDPLDGIGRFNVRDAQAAVNHAARPDAPFRPGSLR